MRHNRWALVRSAPIATVCGPATLIANPVAHGIAIAALSGLTGTTAYAQCAPTPTGVNPVQVVCSGNIAAGGAQFTTGAFTGNLAVQVNSTGVITTGARLNLTDAGNAALTTLTGASITNSAGIGANLSTATAGAVSVINAGIVSGSTAGISTSANSGATTITANGNVTASAVGGVGIIAATTRGNISIGGTGAIQGGAGIVATANATTAGGIDSGSVTILRSGSVTGNAVISNPASPYVGSNGDGIYVVTNGGSVNVGNMTGVTGTANGIWARTGGTGNTTQIVNAGTIQVHDIGTISSAGGIDSALRGWGGGGVTVQNIGTVIGGLDGIHMTAIGTPAVSAFLAQSIGSITAQTRSGIQATATGNLTVAQVGPVNAIVDGIALTSLVTAGITQPAGNISVDTIGAITTATTANGGTGLLLNAQHGSISVNKVAGVQSRLDGVNAVASGSIAVTNSTANIASQTKAGMLLAGGTGVTVTSNQAITGATEGVNATSTAGAINISSNKAITGQTTNGVFANASAGGVTIRNNAGLVGGKSGVIALASGAVLIDANTSISGSSDSAVFASGRTVAFTGNGASTGGKDGVVLSGVTNITVSGNGPITANGGVGLNANASGGDVTIQNNGNIIGTSVGMSAGGTGAVKIIGNGRISGSAGDGINAYNLSGGTPSIAIQNNIEVHGNTNGINAGTSGSVSITGNGKIDGHDGVGMTINAGAGVTLQNNTLISGNTEGAFINAGGGVLVSGNGSVFGGNLNGITVLTPSSATFANNGPIYGNISGINISAGTNVSITSTNSVTGLTGSGIVASTTAGTIVVDHSNGSILGTNAGIKTTGTGTGATSSVTNQATGYIQAATALDVTSGTGTAAISNSGTLNGSQFSIQGQAGGGAFNIANAGTLVGAVKVDGANVATSTFTNSGTFNTGSKLSTYSGNFRQTVNGNLGVDVDWATGRSGRLDVMGTANVAGSVVVNPASFPTTGGLTRQFTILHANGGITNSGLTAANTAAVNYALLSPNANDLVLSATINFQGATQNQTRVAEALNTLVDSGGTSPLIDALLRVPTGSAMSNSLSQLAPTGTQLRQQNVQFVGAFNNAMLSCSVNGDGVAIVAEGQCLWMRARTVHTEVDATSSRPGFKDQMEQISAGVQFALATNWRAGFALGYDQSSTTSENTRTTGDRVAAGGVLKYTSGPWLLAASVSGGWGSYDHIRQIAFTDFSAIATASSDVDFLAARLHAAYLFDLGTFYVKPMIDAGFSHIIRDEFTEQGGKGAGLSVAGASNDVWSVSPAVELGTQVRISEYSLRPFVKLGATFIDPAESTVTASFVGTPAAAFATTARYDSTLMDVGTGFALLDANGAALRMQYDHKAGPTTAQHSISVKGSLPF